MQKSTCNIIIVATVVFLCSCQTSKQLPYFKDLPETAPVTHVATTSYTPLKLQANDELQITISSTSPEASHFFNMASTASSITVNPASSMSPASSPQSLNNLYHVLLDGKITIPVLGDIVVAGLTTEEVQARIMDRLKDYLKEAVVTVKLTNFKVTVIGEVNRPVVVPVNGQTINVLEAIGASGDMTPFGIRKNVRVIRKLPDGTTEVAVLDFNNSSALKSPYFQLRQNDIVYVQPRKSKGLQGSRSNLWVPVVTTLISVAAIVVASNN